jgi:hypothetical protein
MALNRKAGFHNYHDKIPHLILIPLYMIGCIGVGCLAAYLVETPFLDLRERLYPASRQPDAPTQQPAVDRGAIDETPRKPGGRAWPVPDQSLFSVSAE